MKIPIGILALIVAPTVLSVDAWGQQRSQFTTTFSFGYAIGGVPHPAPFPTPEGKRILLPIAFDRWNCAISDVHLSDDGLKVFHNLVCSNIDTTTIVGGSTTCPAQATGSTTDSGFFLVVPNPAAGAAASMPIRVDFWGTCTTSRLSVPLPGPVKNL
jgi:hypothetical protein